MSNQLGQAVINYMGEQPYKNVFGMIAGLQAMVEVDDKDLNEFLAAAEKEAAKVKKDSKT